MRNALMSHAAAAVFALTWFAVPATAAQLTQISYTITSSNLSGPFNNGAGTGGYVVYTPPGGVISTPVIGATGGTLRIYISGTGSMLFSVSFKASLGHYVSAIVAPSYVFFTAGGTDASAGSLGMSSIWPLAHAGIYLGARDGSGNDYVGGLVKIGSGIPFHHHIWYGNEVRTPVTQPVPAATELGLGLLGLGLVASAGATATRVRKRRRG